MTNHKRGWSGGAQDGFDCLGDAVVVLELVLELFLAGGGEAIETDLAVGFGDAPLGGGPAFEEDFLEGWVEGSFFDLQDFAGENVDALGDGIAVEGSGV